MTSFSWYILLMLSVLVVAVLYHLTSDYRLRRRRRRNHGSILSRGRRPAVKFSVRPPKE